MKIKEFPFVQKNLFFLVHIKNTLFGGFVRKYYGQWGEDIILERLFSNVQKGFYVDVGAFHPMHYSNTYSLYKRGWRGINIDPNPQSIRLFNWYRRDDTNLNLGVAGVREKKPYYIFNHQSCNTFSIDQKNEVLKKSFISLINTVDVECVPLRGILDSEQISVPIDLINIDVEGMGLTVLQSIDWGRLSPRVVCVEDEELDFSALGRSAIHSFLIERSYVLFSRVGPTSIYCHTSFIAQRGIKLGKRENV